MKKYHITVYNINTLKTIDEFTSSFKDVNELTEFMNNIQIYNYKYDYFDLDWSYTERKSSKTIPSHYQGKTQPIDLITAQNLNFNLGNVVKYVCRAGKKQGESNLKDLNKAKDYINYEIKRLEMEQQHLTVKEV